MKISQVFFRRNKFFNSTPAIQLDHLGGGRRQLGATAPLPVHLCTDLKVQED